jgi:hypothetical protein
MFFFTLIIKIAHAFLNKRKSGKVKIASVEDLNTFALNRLNLKWPFKELSSE